MQLLRKTIAIFDYRSLVAFGEKTEGRWAISFNSIHEPIEQMYQPFQNY
jgi:hypothetical protein